jgi:hypothetical protein
MIDIPRALLSLYISITVVLFIRFLATCNRGSANDRQH